MSGRGVARRALGGGIAWVRAHRVAAAGLAGLAVLVGVYVGVYAWAHMPPVLRLPPRARAQVMAALSAARDRAADAASGTETAARGAADAASGAAGARRGAAGRALRHPALGRRVRGPVFVKLYLRGKVVFAFQSAAPTRIRDAIEAAAAALAANPSVRALSEADRRASRIKVDIAQGRAPVVTRPEILFALSLVPGVDGLGARVGGKTAYLDPDETLRRGLVTGYRPFKFVKQFKAGLHIAEAKALLAHQLRMTPEAFGRAAPRYFRFRTDGFVEAPWREGRRTSPLPVYRGNTPPPPFNRAAVIRACVAGGNYILRQLVRKRTRVVVRYAYRPGARPRLHRHVLSPGWTLRALPRTLQPGQFKYIYYPLTDNYDVMGYSLPRHAGTTYTLALLYGRLKGRPGVTAAQTARFRAGAERAIGYLAAMVAQGRCRDAKRDFVCVARGGYTDLGSSALPLVAILEYERQTGDLRFRRLARQLANFLLFMQRSDGEFCHGYDVNLGRRRCKDKLLYYSGEAALALAMAAKRLGDRRYREAARRALDYLTGENYAPLTMKFLFGEDHWTCMAAEEIWPLVKRDRYASFCYAFARFQRRHQFGPNEGFADYVGGYGITPFFPPHLTPAGSRTEAMVSTYDLSRHRGEPQPVIAAQIVRAFRYILRHQIRRDNAYLLARPELALGAIRKSPIKYEVRIDYVQHTVDAMVRGLDLVPERSSRNGIRK